MKEDSQTPAGLDRLERLGGHRDRGGMEHYPKGPGHLVQEENLGLEGNLDPEEASQEVEGMAYYQRLVVHPWNQVRLFPKIQEAEDRHKSCWGGKDAEIPGLQEGRQKELREGRSGWVLVLLDGLEPFDSTVRTVL